MTRGHSPGWRPLVAALALLVGAAAACSSASGPTPGSDGDRSGQSSLDAVELIDVAEAVGLDFVHGAFQWDTTGDPTAMMSGGLCWLDVDDDGWLDLFVVNTWSDGEWGRWREQGALPSTRLYHNDEGRFDDITDDAGAHLEVRGTGCVAADLDLDGHTDLYVTTERQNVLLWNDGDGGFEIDDGAAGVNRTGWHAGATVGDVDGDGWPDLFVAGYADLNRPVPGATKGFPNPFEAEPDLLFLSREGDRGRPTFVEVAADAGVEPDQVDYGLGAVFTDVDDDGDLDLYVANDTHPNRLYVNRADDSPLGFGFVDSAPASGVDDDNAGMGVASAHLDGDARPDLTVTNLDQQGHRLYLSTDPPPAYVDARGTLGVPDLGRGFTGWGTTWHDMDLDGDLDLALAHGAVPVNDLVADRQQLQVYAWEDDGLIDVTSEVIGGTDGLLLARGLAAADHDNDGDVDLAVVSIGGPLTLLANTGAGGHWLGVSPQPATPGARVTITLADGTTARREVHAGSSYLSSEDPRSHFGLGPTDTVDGVLVEWPDGTSASRTGVEADQWLELAPD